eukprot:1075532-Rhodomonas_salina.1
MKCKKTQSQYNLFQECVFSCLIPGCVAGPEPAADDGGGRAEAHQLLPRSTLPDTPYCMRSAVLPVLLALMLFTYCCYYCWWPLVLLLVLALPTPLPTQSGVLAPYRTPRSACVAQYASATTASGTDLAYATGCRTPPPLCATLVLGAAWYAPSPTRIACYHPSGDSRSRCQRARSSLASASSSQYHCQTGPDV